MILVLRGADFSANNLGQVEITTELDDYTKAAIAASGNTGMTNVQKSALNTFFKKVGAWGGGSNIWSKMDRVYIPFLCADIANAGHDYTENGDDVTLASDKYVLRNKGLTGALESPATYSGPQIPMLISKRDFSFFIMTTEQINGNSQTSGTLLGYTGNSGSNRFYASLSSVSSGNAIILRADHLKPSGASLLPNVGKFEEMSQWKLTGYSLTGTDTASCITFSGLIKEVIYTNWDNIGDDNAKNNTYIFTNSNGQPLAVSSKSIGMFMMGHGLTNDEMLILKEASDKLAEFFVE